MQINTDQLTRHLERGLAPLYLVSGDEPLQVEDAAGRDAAPARVTEVAKELAQLAQARGFLRGIHDVRVRDTSDGEIVNFHCYVDPARAVHDVHENVDEVERGLRRRFPMIKRVIGHAEPRFEI